jgi:hypothetical protein
MGHFTGERFFPRRNQAARLDTHRGRGGTDNVRHWSLAGIDRGEQIFRFVPLADLDPPPGRGSLLWRSISKFLGGKFAVGFALEQFASG